MSKLYPIREHCTLHPRHPPWCWYSSLCTMIFEITHIRLRRWKWRWLGVIWYSCTARGPLSHAADVLTRFPYSELCFYTHMGYWPYVMTEWRVVLLLEKGHIFTTGNFFSFSPKLNFMILNITLPMCSELYWWLIFSFTSTSVL